MARTNTQCQRLIQGECACASAPGGGDWLVHHSQHRQPACPDKAPDKYRRQREEDDVQHGRLVEVHPGHLDLRVGPCSRQPETLEEELDDQAGGGHRGVEADEQEAGHAPAVVLAVDVDDRQHDQVGEDASTPPKLIPPFHSTAASGTLPIEQTKLMIATSGPHSFVIVWW